MLLYPGNVKQSTSFKTFETDDYASSVSDNIVSVDHQCKLGYVSVLSENKSELSDDIAIDIFD